MLRKMRKEEFDSIYEIMLEAFPIDERRSFDEEKQLLSNPAFEISVWHDDDKIKGFISVYHIDDFCFVEHFAVSPKYRNEGIGKSVLQQLLGIEKKVCLEVEPPVTENAKRRIDFYRRNGFYLNEYPYIQPPISKGTEPIPLLIMTTGGMVDEEEFSRIKQSLYVNVYGINNQRCD